MVDKNSQEKDTRRPIRFNSENIEFKLKTLINELSTVLVLMELAKKYKNDPENPDLPVYLINKGLESRYQNPESSKQESIVLRPTLIYDLMNDLANETNDINFVSKKGSDYQINEKGLEFLKKEILRIDRFIEQYQKIKKDVFDE